MLIITDMFAFCLLVYSQWMHAAADVSDTLFFFLQHTEHTNALNNASFFVTDGERDTVINFTALAVSFMSKNK